MRKLKSFMQDRVHGGASKCPFPEEAILYCSFLPPHSAPRVSLVHSLSSPGGVRACPVLLVVPEPSWLHHAQHSTKQLFLQALSSREVLVRAFRECLVSLKW